MVITKTRILDLSHSELKELISSLGEPEFRANQILGWVYKKFAASFAAMTDLPQSFRQKLEKLATLSTLVPLDEKSSADGETLKVLFRLTDGNTIESVFMTYSSLRVRGTVCLSTQAGCPIGCPFCATGQQGFVRNLSSGEIIEQVLYFSRLSHHNGRRPVTNVVFMGMGEPLANYEAVMRAIYMLNSDVGFKLSARKMTLSTAGLVPQMKRLADEKITPELAISLHAATNELRDYLVPANRKYPLESLISVCRSYLEKTGRRPTFECALFQGVNDSLSQARELANLLKGCNCHINLMAGNRTKDKRFIPASPKRVLAFHKELKGRGIQSTAREARGQDIEAGCGQLKSRFLGNKEMSSHGG